MRLTLYRLAGLARVSAILAVGMIVFSAGAAPAWSRYRDHVYADSFGNLVIQSPSGYKRIIVGQGHLAKELSSYEGPDEPDPDVVYLDDNRDGDGYRSYRDCYRPPYLFKGRSYMYGLADGVLPQAPCR
jgi:hypothetical protein